MMRQGRKRRGSTLIMAVFIAIIFAVAAYAVLFMSLGLRQRVDFSERTLRARYAAESGYVIALEKRWAGGPCPQQPIDFDDDDNPATLPVRLSFTCPANS